jgi:hypothetical protein
MTVLELAAALVTLPDQYHYCQVVIDDHGDQLVAESLIAGIGTQAGGPSIVVEISGNVMNPGPLLLYLVPGRLAEHRLRALAEQLDPENVIPPLPPAEPLPG